MIIARVLAMFVGLLSAIPGFASALVENAIGNVTARVPPAPAVLVQTGQRIFAGTTVVTGPRSQATLRFDDGQAMLLAENSEFRVSEYSFSSAAPANDRFGFALLKGAVRSVTGIVTNRTSNAYSMATPTAAIGIRGTDFMVALLNETYLSVLNGAVSAANAAGEVIFGAGSTAVIASATTLPIAISAGALPGSVAATFGELSAVQLTAAAATTTTTTAGTGAGGGAGAGAATSGAFGGLGIAGAVGVAAVIGAVLSAGSSDTPTGTTGTR